MKRERHLLVTGVFLKGKNWLPAVLAFLFLFSIAAAQEGRPGSGRVFFEKGILRAAWKERRNVLFSPYLVESSIAVLGYGLGDGFYEKLVEVFGAPSGNRGTCDEAGLQEIAGYSYGRGHGLSIRWKYMLPGSARPTPVFRKMIKILRMEQIPGGGLNGGGGKYGKSVTVVQPSFVIEGVLRFRGKWASLFHRRETRKDVFFYDSGGDVVPLLADFMRGEKNCFFAYGRGFKALSLDFEGGFAVLLVLPFPGLDLSFVLDNLDPMNLFSVFSEKKADKWKINVDIEIPKIHFSSHGVIPGWLREIKGRDSFRARFADVSRILEFPKGFPRYDWEIRPEDVSEIRWDEEGCVAFSRLKWEGKIIGSSRPKTFHANRPFLFFIIDKNKGKVLLSGLACRVGKKDSKVQGEAQAQWSRVENDPDEELIKKLVSFEPRKGSGVKKVDGGEGRAGSPFLVRETFLLATEDLRISILDWVEKNRKGKELLPYTDTILFALTHGGEKVRKRALGILERNKKLGDFGFILQNFGRRRGKDSRRPVENPGKGRK